MNILTIDVTDKKLVVACSNNDKVFSKISEESGKKHNSLIMPFVESVLMESGLTLKDIDVYSCVVGPGSFTGIRIGIATIKALSFAMNKPCVSINALEELAYGKEGEFITAIDAMHDNYYAATFNGSIFNMKDMDCFYIDDIKSKNLPIYFKNGESDPDKLISITKEKANKGVFEALEPVYLRKSQAERDQDAK